MWLERHGIDGAYVPLAVAPADLEAVVRGLAKAGFAGANVTIPHKEAVMALCDSVEPFAKRAGAVNTLVFGNGIEGRNTDGYGFVANLRAHGVVLSGRALILGAGGAARAIGAALQDEGFAVVFCNRTAARAVALASALDAEVLPWEERASLEGFSLLVNTTALGMTGKEPLVMDLGRAGPGLVVADIVYAPLETALLSAARARGLHAVEGLGMLLHQAVPGFAAWFGVTPVVDAALYQAVAG
jgi:shikimate dehydrogenase